jgi:hypothetical protein
MTVSEWVAGQDSRFRGEAATLAERIARRAAASEVRVDRHGILGFGCGADGHPLVALAVRKDGLRLYANVAVVAAQAAALGRKRTGKSCISLRRAADIDDDLLTSIVDGSLQSPAMCEP